MFILGVHLKLLGPMVLVVGGGSPKTRGEREIPLSGIGRQGHLGCLLTGLLLWSLQYLSRISLTYDRWIQVVIS